MTFARTGIARRNDRTRPRGQASFFIIEPLLLLALSTCCFSTSSLLAQSPTLNFEAEAAKASAARESGNIKEALQAYYAATQVRPDWDEGWWYLGTLNYDADHFPQAIAALSRFVQLDQNVGAGWAFLGLSEFEVADYENAFNHLQRAQELGFAEDPDVERVAIYHLALLLNRRGAFEESTRLLGRTFNETHLPDQIKIGLGLAFLRVPLLPSEIDPARDALLHAAGNVAAQLAKQDLETAGTSFQQMIRDFPSTPYLHYEYGLALMSRAQFDSAEAQFHEEGLVTPHSPASQVGLASLNLQRGRSEEAILDAQNAIRIDPGSAAAYRALAEALRQKNSDDEATAAAKQARRLTDRPPEIDPGQTQFYAMNREPEVTGNRPQTEQAQPEKDHLLAQNFDAIARQASGAREAGHIADAVALYQQGTHLRPDWQEGWRQLGTLLYMQEDFSGAASALRRSAALESKQADTWTLLGLCEFKLKDYKNALAHLEKGQALGFGGNTAAVRYARYHLALLLNLEEEFDAATDLLIPEARPGPQFDEIQFALGLALLRMPILPDKVEPAKQDLVRTAGKAAVLLSESRYDSAFPILEKLIREYPDTPFLHYAYGDALAATSDYDRAQAQLREEARDNPRSLIVYLRLAAIALRLNQPQSALDSATMAVKLAPDSPDAHYLLGRSYFESDDTTSAIPELERARRLAPGSPAVHFNLARAYAKAKRSEEAERERGEFQRLNAQLSAKPEGRPTSENNALPAGEVGETSSPSITK